MNKHWIIKSIIVLQLLLIGGLAELQATEREKCLAQVRQINAMPLFRAAIAPIDSAGKYVKDECAPLGFADHCVLLSDVRGLDVGCVGVVYFDSIGRIRKTINTWSDGGDLNNIVYYGEDGDAIYAVFNDPTHHYGKIYVYQSKIYTDLISTVKCKDLGNGFELWLPLIMATEQFMTVFKLVDLTMPEGCLKEKESFAEVRAGDHVALCADQIYATPNSRTPESFEFGRRLLVGSVVDGWCELRFIDELRGYARIEDVELIW